jgi:hypothetical protein
VPTISTLACVRCVSSLAFMSYAALYAQEVEVLQPAVEVLQRAQTTLHIAVVSGEGAVHAAAGHAVRPVTIAVTDRTGRPVEGARVSFQVPQEGPGGVFASGLGTDLAITGPDGHATVRSLQLNRVAGRFLIRVTAAKDQARAGIVLQQYIGDPNAARESADRSSPIPTPASGPAPAPEPARAAVPVPNSTEDTPVVAPPAAPPEQPKRAALVVIPLVPLRPKKATKAEALALAIQPAAGVAPLKSAHIPTIIITQNSTTPGGRSMVSRDTRSHKKLIWIVLLAAGVAGGAFAGSSMAATSVHNSGSAAAAISSVTIGTPTINIGKP